ncbi:hypothetical protein ACT3SZ_09105 [Corynebacterium sp. AOP40-9SA-29]|uniref:hypothetical protein n=1 Tax=Corynebacterium sp. AOP40-9SA-29 TaxID=3457677 RepID=UPI004034A052
MRPRRKTGVLGQEHAPDRDLDIAQVRPDAPRPPSEDGGFGEDFWEGQRPPHW